MESPPNPFAPPAATLAQPVEENWIDSGARSVYQVATGLACLHWGVNLIIIALFAFLGTFLLGVLLGPLALVLVAAALLTLFGGYVLLFVGPMMCLSVPDASRAKGAILSTVILFIVALLLTIANVLVSFEIVRIPPLVPAIAARVFTFAGTLMLIVFLRRMGRFLGRRDVVRRSKSLMMFAIVLCLLVLALTVYSVVGAPPKGTPDSAYAMILFTGGILLVPTGGAFLYSLGGLAELLRRYVLKDPRTKYTGADRHRRFRR